MDIDDSDSVQKVIQAHRARYWKLKEQAAELGITRDPRYDIEMERIEEEIKKLRKSINDTPTTTEEQEDTKAAFLELSNSLESTFEALHQSDMDAFLGMKTLAEEFSALFDRVISIIEKMLQADKELKDLSDASSLMQNFIVVATLAFMLITQISYDSIVITLFAGVVFHAILSTAPYFWLSQASKRIKRPRR